MSNKNNYINNKKRLRHQRKVRRLKAIYSLCIIVFVLFSSKVIINKTFSSKSAKPTPIVAEDIFTVCLDAGHGDWDFGTIGLNKTSEKDIDLAITLKVGKLLEAQGIKVVYTRTNDNLTWSDNSTDNLYDRIEISEKNNSDLFISIHCNGSEESSSYKGIETWCNGELEEDKLLASYIQNELSALQYTEDRGLKFYDPLEPLIVLEHTDITSALIELGFLSNADDEAFLTSKSGQKLISGAISKGVLSYI
ncbi:MAG: N-acetylmuramoyl-L-alanine amidase family protein, partial [Clostridium sp.]